MSNYYPVLHDPRAARTPASTHPSQYVRQEMYSSVHMASNVGFPGSNSGEMMPNESQQVYYNQYQYPVYLPSPATPPSPEHSYSSSSSQIPNTPDSTITTSSNTDYSDNDADVDAMVDAAMHESGLFTSALLSDDDIELDRELMQEMHELFTSSRKSTSDYHWDQMPVLHDHPQMNMTTPIKTVQDSHPVIPEKPAFAPHEANVLENESTEDSDMEDIDIEVDMTDMKELGLLMRQLKFLEAQRDFLEYQAAITEPSETQLSTALIHRRNAIDEKKKLMEAQLMGEMLRNALNHQFENMKYVHQQLLESPLTHYRNTLTTPMESYIHLTKDMKERRAVLQALREEKLDSAKRFLDFQCRNIDIEKDFFFLDSFEKFGKFYTIDFSISKLADTTVEDVASVFYFHFVFTKDRIAQILGSVENREYFDGIDWVFLHGRFVDRINLLKRRKHTKNFVVQESNTVFYAAQVGDAFVMTCDNIDKDELHPYRSNGRIRKDMIFGVVVEPYTDSHGNNSVLLKRFSFYRHHFNNIEPSSELLQAISTKIILWGQAVRMCVTSREKDRLPLPLSRKPLKRAGAPMVLTNW